ncbi:MAG: ABC transporter permease [Gemmobacter sp.]
MIWVPQNPVWLVAALAVWLALWGVNALLARQGRGGPERIVAPVIFGVAVLVLWEGIVRAYEVNAVILPAPSAIAAFVRGPLPLPWGDLEALYLNSALPTLWADFVQTFVKGALSGYVIGCGAGVAVAVLIDRSPFLTRGLLPVGNFVAALPIVGVAPILVMWFGFDWQSKAAVVVVLVFFPVLVNTVAGLASSDRMARDLMATYGAAYWPTMVKLRLPAAMPFVFNGLKIATTLAMIGAIVAEYFGSPVYGMGFRISTGVGRLAMDLVWAEIAVAALAGSAFYGVVAMIERRVTFWHPAQRARV